MHTQDQIHGHEVMKMMITSNRTFDKPSLREAIIEHFGEDARFYTCSQQNMTAENLIEFLEQRGKFVDKGSGFNTDADKICSH